MQQNSDPLPESASADGGASGQRSEQSHAAGDHAPATPRHFVDLAREYLSQGNTDEAEAACLRALALDPNLADARRTLGFIARGRKDHAGAIAHFEQARRQGTSDSWSTFEIGQEYRTLGRLDEALAQYQAALDMKPDFAEARRGIGLIARDRGDHEGAFGHLKTAGELAPNNQWIQFEIAEECRKLGRPDEALAHYQAALIVKPDFAEAGRFMGIVERDRGHHEAALGHFQAASDLAPNNFLIHLDIAQQYRILGRNDEAVTAFRAVLAIKPDFAEVHRLIGVIDRDRADHEAALASFRAAHAMAPDHAQYDLDIAAELLSLGRPEEADEVCRRVLAAGPGLPEAHRMLGFIARGRNDRLAALAHFDSARRQAPGDHWSTFEAGQEYRALGRPDEALAEYRAALAIKPDFAEAHRSMALIARDAGDHEEALTHLLKAAELAPGNLWIHLDIAQEYRSAGRPDAALAHYRAMLAIKPDFAEAHRWIGMLDRDRGDHEAALGHFKTASSLAPDNYLAHLDIAQALRALGRDDEALAAFHDVLSLRPDFAEIHRLIGIIARERKNHEKALEHFRVARAIMPDHLQYDLEIIEEFRNLGRRDEAEAACRALLAINPGLAGVHRMLGFMARDRKDHLGAIAHFEDATSRDPDDHASMIEIAWDYVSLERYEDAVAFYRAALAIKPDLAEAHRGLGVVANARRRYEEALDHLRMARDLAPANPWIYLDIALQYRTLERYDEALAECGAALAVRPDFPDAHRIMGVVEMSRGDIAAADRHFADALAVMEAAGDARAGQYLVPTVEILLQLKQTDKAAERLKAADVEALSPLAKAEICRLRAAVARKMADHDEELACLRASLALRRDHKSSWLALIEREAGTGHFDAATRTIEEARLDFPDDVDFAIERSRILRILGRMEESRAEIRNIGISDRAPVLTWIRLADELRYNGMLAEARDMGCAAVARDPANAGARISLALIDLEIEGPATALAQLQAFIAAGHASVEVVYHTSRLLRETGDPAAALRLMEERGLTWQAPQHVFQELVLSLIQTDDLKRGWEYLERRRQFNGDDKDDLSLEIELDMAAGNIRKIQQVLAGVLEERLTHAGLAARIIRLAGASHNFEVVIAAQKDLIALEPSRELHGMIAVAEAEFHLGHGDRAHQILNDLNEKFGDIPAISAMRAQLLTFSGQLMAALAILEDGKARHPDNAALWSQSVRVMLLAGALDAASKALADVVPLTKAWSEERALLDIELSLERRDLKGGLRKLDMFTPSYVSNRRYYYHLAARAALGEVDMIRAKEYLRSEASILRLEKRLRRQSTNMLQSLLGQLFDDYRLDDGVVRALRQSFELPAHERTGRLLEIARDNEESTAAAITTVFHLRERGLLAVGDHAWPSPIPKRLIQFWDTRQVPDDISGYMETWRRHNPDWSYKLVDIEQARDFIRTNCPVTVLKAFNKAGEPAMKADLFRLAWLNAGGGAYADADDVCTAPLDNLLVTGAGFVAHQEYIGSVGNNFLAAVPGHPAIAWALEEAVEAILRGDSDMVWLSTGPGLITRAFVHWLATAPDLAAALGETLLLDRSELIRVCVPHCHATYKFTPQHWSQGLFG